MYKWHVDAQSVRECTIGTWTHDRFGCFCPVDPSRCISIVDRLSLPVHAVIIDIPSGRCIHE